MNTFIEAPHMRESFLTSSGIDLDVLLEDLKQPGYPAKAAKEYLAKASDCFNDMYCAGADIRGIIESKAWFMDQVLKALWLRYDLDPENYALIAVGGYGRGELQPYSDIDLLILGRDEISSSAGEALSSYITLLWDLQLDIGHSVRTIDECIEQAKGDVTIATNLLETRTIAGAESLEQTMSSRVYSDEVFTSEIGRASCRERV